MNGKKRKNFIDKITMPIAIIILLLGIMTILIFSSVLPFNDWSFQPDSELFAQYGNFIGGFVGTIFSLVGVLLLYQTLIAQQKSLEQQILSQNTQKQSFEIEQFENTFFNLLKTQQDLTGGIKAYFKTTDSKFNVTTSTILGREFFAYSKLELQRIWTSLESEKYMGTFSEDPGYFQYLDQEIDMINDPNYPEYTTPIDAKEATRKIIEDERIRYTNTYYNISKEVWTEIKEKALDRKIESLYGLFFKRYHYAIGHYFRHLYHIIKFTRNFRTSESKSDIVFKRKYTDFIQAQMSSFELMLLFYNSLAFPKLFDLLKEFNFLENLAEEDLISISHNCIDGFNLKKRNDLLGEKK